MTLLAFRRLPSLFLLACAFLAFGASPLRPAQLSTGSIGGRIINPVTGSILERARVSVEGTTLETFTDADGFYRLTNIPPGTVRLRAFFTGFPPVAATVTVAAGQNAEQNFELAPAATAPVVSGATVQLDEFVVATSREMSASALAINEQRFAPNMKNVVATDEFGDIAEGNVAEFLKFLPGVNIDYAGGNAREVSIDGVPGDYVPVTIDT